MIEIKNLVKKYDRNTALDNVNLKIYPREFVILVGPSGAGKSTLIKMLIREEKPDRGEIKVAGRNVLKLSSGDLPYYRRNIGTVFQDYKLLPSKNVFENVSYALEVAGVSDEEIARRVPKVLRAVNLEAKSRSYPNQLSGGEAQRVSIARSLVHNPKILIADEPTGNLDPEAGHEVAMILEKINCLGTCVVLATHNKELVDRMRKRVVGMKEGRVVSDQQHGRYSC
ncbi:MAG: ATP-binding cassette domain-containing protein [bacterium]